MAFISLSARLNTIFPAPLDRAKAYLENLGYRVRVIFNASAKEHQRLSHPALRRNPLRLHRPSIHALLCTIGGSSSNELLKYLEYSLIREHPKIFCGYSDITVLHYTFFAQAGLRLSTSPQLSQS
jgi:muramoyltetrapeptide carboxypeptidase